MGDEATQTRSEPLGRVERDRLAEDQRREEEGAIEEVGEEEGVGERDALIVISTTVVRSAGLEKGSER